jgi:hypothetical protein
VVLQVRVYEGHTFAATAMHLLAMSLELAFHVVIMPNLQEETNAFSVSTFSSREGSSLFFAVYGSGGASPVEALLNPLEDIVNSRDW